LVRSTGYETLVYTISTFLLSMTHLDPDIFHGRLFSEDLSLRSSLKAISLYILMFKIYTAQRKTKDSELNYSRNSLISISS